MVKYYHPNILYINWAKEVIEHRVQELNAKESKQKDIEKKKQQQEQISKKNTNAIGKTLDLPVVDLNRLNFTPTGKLFQ